MICVYFMYMHFSEWLICVIYVHMYTYMLLQCCFVYVRVYNFMCMINFLIYIAWCTAICMWDHSTNFYFDNVCIITNYDLILISETFSCYNINVIWQVIFQEKFCIERESIHHLGIHWLKLHIFYYLIITWILSVQNWDEEQCTCTA